MKRGCCLNDILRPLCETPSQAYLSNVAQVADLLDWILDQTGPAEVWLTSFSISEEFLRRLHFIKAKGRITAINLVLDHKATLKTLRLWSFISQTIDSAYLADNHSKLLLINPIKWGGVISVITSQNLTRGNRQECAFISTEKHIFDSMLGEVRNIINNHSVSLHDLFNKAISPD